MSTTPIYRGAGQPVLQSTHWLGGLASVFGSQTAPAYLGSGQPATGTAGPLSSSAPVYKQAPPPQLPNSCVLVEPAPVCTEPTQAVLVCPTDCDPLAAGPITIIVPRQG